MATYTGAEGSLKFGLTTAALIGQVKDWTFSIDRGDVDTTFLGAEIKTQQGTLPMASGTMKVAYDKAFDSPTKTLIEQLLVANAPGNNPVELYTNATEKITGTILLGKCSFSNETEALILFDISFKFNTLDLTALHVAD